MMQLKVKILNIDSGGKPFVFLNDKDADELNITASERVTVKAKRKITAIVNISASVEKGFLGVTEEVRKILFLKQNNTVTVDIAPFPKSLQFIRNKLSGKKLLYSEIHEIVQDLVDGNLNENEISAFITALHIDKLDLDEATSLSRSMVDTGKTLSINKKIIIDKHSIGGVPGDKTTLLVVPIVASEGFTIPKTSSRAITSAAGTADRAEILMPVEFTTNKMLQILKKSNGCIAWGGAIDLAPADDMFVKIEFSLHIDPLLLPSIMSKKKAVGATHLYDYQLGHFNISDASISCSTLIAAKKALDAGCEEVKVGCTTVNSSWITLYYWLRELQQATHNTLGFGIVAGREL